ncbi:MAG: glycosyltransferase [Lutibacter sp.]|uniref:glycosyltransferase n=1 Tax=Lutibacter sp. TaxID=1925666 RepID=UPI00299DC60C|nr:glycosyltransferase [Lutibacter sp.]MDX1830159.1 glycosyltransferase [Lutibacter sp.]
MTEYLFITFIVIIGIQLIYYLVIFGAFAFPKNNKPKNNFNPPISILICAKNESQNLAENIPSILSQNYPNFEIVLINDSSTDTTLEVMKNFKKEYPDKINLVNVLPNEQFWGSKKYALTLGIKAAKYNYLLLTDADCKPVSKNWITLIATHFSNNKQLILGYGAYKKIKKSFLNKLIRFETLLTAIQYFSYQKIGLPYMGVGRNLGYTKDLFFSANGFTNHIKVKSGDDDLFVNQVATKQNSTYCIDPESFTESNPKTSFKEWIHQKRRHVSTARHYKPLHKLLLGLFYSSQILFWLLAIILILLNFDWKIIVGFIVFRLLIQYIIIGFSAKKLKETDLILLFPFMEIFLITTQMFIFIKNLIAKPTHW